MATERKPKAKKKKTSKRSSRSTTVISMELPQTWGPECFNETTINKSGFQAADLKPRYYAAFCKLHKEYGQGLTVTPSGNPGITISLKS